MKIDQAIKEGDSGLSLAEAKAQKAGLSAERLEIAAD